MWSFFSFSELGDDSSDAGVECFLSLDLECGGVRILVGGCVGDPEVSRCLPRADESSISLVSVIVGSL